MNTLFILNNYYPYKDANSVCVYNVIKEEVLLFPENRFFIACLSEEVQIVEIDNNTTVYTTIKNNSNTVYQLLQKVANYPVRNYLDAVALTKITQQLLQKNSIDKVVCVVNPMESLMSLLKLKKTYPNVEWIIYELDSITDLDNKRFGIDGLKWLKD